MVATHNAREWGSLSPAFSLHPAQPLDYELVTVRTESRCCPPSRAVLLSGPHGGTVRPGMGHAIPPLVHSISPLGKTPLVRPQTMEYEEE